MADAPEDAASFDSGFPKIPQRMGGFARLTSTPRSFLFPTFLDGDAISHAYTGNGTADDPYIVEYLQNDPKDALNFPMWLKLTVAATQALSTMLVTMASSVYASDIEGVMRRFHVSEEVATLGLALYVLGFAVGPLFWAPISETYGRRFTYVVSFAGYTAFSVGAVASQNIQTLLILRFLASAFGSSCMTNSGAFIADMFNKEQRGLATSLYAAAPFFGPALGPICGGFLAETKGWRWILGFAAVTGAVIWIATTLVIPETYAPYILGRRAQTLSRLTRHVYMSRSDVGKPPKTLVQQFKVALSRPWILLFREPIVFLTSLYMAIVYGILYLLFAAVPIVFRGSRGWNQGTAGLPFVGVAIGVVAATLLNVADNKRYVRHTADMQAKGRPVEPEARLIPAIVGAVVLPIGLFLFAWTTYPSVHWIAPIIGATFFAFGLVLVFISQISYLIDSYTIYAASVLAAGSALRSFFGTAFPLFTTQMYTNLGDQWASSIPAFLSLACVPIPLLFYVYGPKIRVKCKFAAESAKVLEMMRRAAQGVTPAVPEKKVENQA